MSAKQTFKVVLEWDAETRAWVTYVPTLEFLSTFGSTREEALDHTRDAILLYLESARDEGIEVAMPDCEVVDLEVASA